MNKEDIYNLFKETIASGDVLMDEPMSNHTSFKIGGPVDIMVIPRTIEDVSKTIKTCRENNLDYFVIGNGSNLLIRDKGMRGVIIKISEELNGLKIEGNTIIAQAGILLSKVSKVALKHSLKGLEFASGIPGSLGGAIAMNAGAYNGEMKDVVTKVKCIDMEGNIIEYSNGEMEFGYRQSRVQRENLVVVEVDMELEKGVYEEIKAYMDELTQRRTSKQPLELPSAGSTFKRPEGYYAGKLIDDAGLRGLRLGGAQVSQKHCGFVVNVDNAIADDVINLIKVVQKTVRDRFGVELETEVKIVGEE